MNQNFQNEFYGHDRRDVLAVLKRRGGVLALNTTFATPNWLQAEGIAKIESCFAPVRAFSQLFDPNPYAPKAKNIIKYVTSGSNTIVDGTNFQVGGSNIDGLEVSVSHYSQPWPVTAKDLNSGIRPEDLFFANMQELSNTLATAIGFWFSTAVFPATPITSVGTAFGLGDAALVAGRVPGPKKSLILHPVNFAMMAHGSGKGFNSGDAVHGWKGGIHEMSAGWTGKVRGIGCAPTALVTVTGTLAEFNSNTIQRSLIGLPGLDLTIEWNRWFDAETRTNWNSLDCIFGVTIAQADAGVLIVEP